MRTQRKNNQIAKSAGKRGRPNASRDGFSFASDWLGEWREFFYQSQSEMKQNQSRVYYIRPSLENCSELSIRFLGLI